MECLSKRQLVARACILIKNILQFFFCNFLLCVRSLFICSIVFQIDMLAFLSLVNVCIFFGALNESKLKNDIDLLVQYIHVYIICLVALQIAFLPLPKV